MEPLGGVARPRVRVHVVGVDDEQRMLFSRRPLTQMWTLPWRYLRTDEDPAESARSLIVGTGASPGRPRILSIESAAELGDHFIDVTFGCSAQRTWRSMPTPTATPTPTSAPALWWSLNEISSLDLTTRAKSALVAAWADVWPHI